MKNGSILQEGPLKTTFSSKNLSQLLNYPTKVRVLTPQGIKLDIDAEEELNQKISRLESLS